MNRALALLLILAFNLPAFADEVIQVDSQQNERRRTGEILDYRGSRLTLKSNTGREIVIPQAQIKDITAAWSEPHQKGNAEFSAHQYALALDSYQQAFRVEDRGWVKRKLLERILRCQHNTGNVAEACQSFSKLLADDNETPYFASIPLAWTNHPVSGDVQKLAMDWIGSRNPSVLRLLAASWLLSSPDRKLALDTLRELARHPREEVRSLAMCQFWRTQLVTVQQQDLDRWASQLNQITPSLRGGAYYLLGKGLAQQGQGDNAALALLRVPTQFEEQALLAQAALVEAAKVLRQQGETTEVPMLLRQAMAYGADTVEGRDAAAMLATDDKS